MAASASIPASNFTLSSPKGTVLFNGPNLTRRPIVQKIGELPVVAEKERFLQYSSDGRLMTFNNNEARVVKIVDATTNKPIRDIKVRAALTALSPSGTYLVTADIYRNEGENMQVWEIASGKLAGAFVDRNPMRDWPGVRWSQDEALALRILPTAVHIYTGKPFSPAPTHRINQPGISIARFSPIAPYKIATFVCEKKGKPALITTYRHGEYAGKPMFRQNFFNAQSGVLKWSPSGQHLLAHFRTEQDKSGGSYYGKSSAQLINVTRKGGSAVLFPHPVHDVAWAPSRDEFVVIYGTKPYCTELYDGLGKLICKLSTEKRNQVEWSPHGRFFCVGAFGSMQGHIDFFDRETLKSLGSTQVSAMFRTMGKMAALCESKETKLVV